MKSKALIGVSLALVMLLTLAAPAFAATQKVDLVKYAGLHPAARAGYATFTTNQGDEALVVRITVTNATVKTKYGVYLLTECGVNYTLGYLTTNSKGKWGGQNEQYQFEQVLSAGQHQVSLVLKPIIDGIPDEFSKTWIWGPDPLGQTVTISITKN